MSELEEKIQQLSEVGSHDSAGVFTLDPTQAREKLYRFQLPERAYVLNLFASFIAGGATRLTVYQDADDVKLTGDAVGVSRTALLNLFASPLAEAGSELDTVQLRELAIGVHGALSYEPRWIKVECCDGENAHRLYLSSDEHRLESLEATPQSFFRVHIKFPVTIMKALFTPQSEMVESHLMTERCSLAPVEEFLLNGRPGRYALTMGETLIYRIGTGPGAPRVGLVRAEAGIRDEVVSERSFVLSLGEESAGPNLTVLHHGVSFEQNVDFGWPLRGTVWAGDELQKDLSQAAIVRDGVWEELIKFLQGQALELAETLWGRVDELHSDQREKARPVLSRLLEHLRSQGRSDDVLALSGWLGESADMGASLENKWRQPACPVCGDESIEEGRLLAGGLPLEFELKDGSRQPVQSLGCGACSHIWLKLR